MKPGFLCYLRLQGQRIGRLFLQTLLISLLLLGSILLLGGSVLEKNSSGEATKRVRVGLVGIVDDSLLKMGVTALQNMDSSRFSVEFLELPDEAAARAQLQSGALSAYLRVPPDFIERAYAGEVQPMTYVSTDGAVGIGSALVDEIVGSISELLSSSEDAVYGLQSYVRDHVPGIPPGQAGDQLVERFLRAILARNRLFRLETVGVGNELSLVEYYVCGFLILFLLLWSTTCSPVFSGRDMELSRLLKARGMPLWQQMLSEFLTYYALMLLTLLCLGLLAWGAARAVDLEALGVELPGRAVIRRFLLYLIPVSVMIAALQYLLYELAPGVIHGVLLQFLAAIVLGYVSGCLYPISFFPVSIQRLASVLPTGLGMSCLSAALRKAPVLGQILGLAGYGAVFLGLSVLARRLRLERMTDF